MFNLNFKLQIKSRDHSIIYTHDIRDFSLNYPTGSLELVLCGRSRAPSSLTGERLSTETKEQRSWIAVFSSIKISGSWTWVLQSKDIFHVFHDPSKPQRAPSLCRKAPVSICCCPAPRYPDYGPTSACFFVIVNNQDELPMINNIALTLTPVVPERAGSHIQPSFLCLWSFWPLVCESLVIYNI